MSWINKLASRVQLKPAPGQATTASMAPPEVVDDRLKKMPYPPSDEAINAGTTAPPAPPQMENGVREVERYWVYEPFAYVSILYDDRAKEHTYILCEPKLSDFEAMLLERLYSDLRDILIRSEINSATADRKEVLQSRCSRLLNIYGIKLDGSSQQKLLYFIERNYLGYGKIDGLMRDPALEDISCNGVGIPIFLFHQRYQNIKTNVIFAEEELNSAVIRLAQRGGKHISIATPIANATLPDGSRIEATLGREVTTRGSSFTIRKFRADPFTPVDLLRYNTMSAEIVSYLWLAIENNKNLIFAGGTASGKTSSLNAVSLFIPQTSKVITIEDTRELMLFHSNWIAGLTRESQMQGNSVEIDMFELLRAALRQRPEYIIVGEVRGREALTLFQAMNTGHTTYSTMHGGSVQSVVNRLLNEPINVPNMMLLALNIVSIQELVFVKGQKLRRMRSIVEITGIDPRTNNLRINELYRWNTLEDTYELMGDSVVLANIMLRRGWDKVRLNQEIANRIKVLEYLKNRNIRDFKKVTIAINAYHIMPDKVLEMLNGDEFEKMIDSDAAGAGR